MRNGNLIYRQHLDLPKIPQEHELHKQKNAVVEQILSLQIIFFNILSPESSSLVGRNFRSAVHCYASFLMVGRIQ